MKEARRVEGQLLAEVDRGRHRGPRARTLDALLVEWLAWRETNGKPISPRTLYGYRRLIDSKIRPALGNVRIHDLDARTLDRFYAALRKDGNARKARNENGQVEVKGGPLSTSRVREVHAVLSGALGLAARWGELGHNPTRLATPPAQRSKTRPHPSVAEVRRLLEEATSEDPVFGLFVRLTAATGLRPGELCALWWADVAPHGAEIQVGHNVIFLNGLPGGFLRKPPKSENGIRPVSLDRASARLLCERRRQVELAVQEAGGAFNPDRYVFAANLEGTRPIRPDTISKRFSKFARKGGYPYTLYGLRHFMATQLGATAAADTLRHRMGHGSLAVTSLYTHRVAEADRAAAAHLGDLLDGGESSGG